MLIIPAEKPIKQSPKNMNTGCLLKSIIWSKKFDPPIINMAIVIIMNPLIITALFYIFYVKIYIKGQVHAYKIAGIPYARPITVWLYPKLCKYIAKFGAKYYKLIIIFIWAINPNKNLGF